MTRVIMRKTGMGFIPADDAQAELLPAMQPGQLAQFEIRKPRNLKFHRKYFAMLRATFDMQDQYQNLKHWRDAVQIAAGHCETFITHTGQVNYKPKSISFADCDETKFNRIYQDAIQAICDHWIKAEPDQLNVILEYA